MYNLLPLLYSSVQCHKLHCEQVQPRTQDPSLSSSHVKLRYLLRTDRPLAFLILRTAVPQRLCLRQELLRALGSLLPTG